MTLKAQQASHVIGCIHFDKADGDAKRLTSLCVLLGPSVEVVALDQP